MPKQTKVLITGAGGFPSMNSGQASAVILSRI